MPENTTAADGPRRGRKKKLNAEKKMLEAGLQLMAANGVFECRVEQITQAAGMGKGSFFNYFGSKEGFVVRLVDFVLSDLARRVRPVGLTPTDAESLLAGVGAVHMRYFQLRPQAASLLTQACQLAGHEKAGDKLRLRVEQHLELLCTMLEPACEPLGWPPERARELALMILANCIGYFWFGNALGIGQDIPMNLLDRLAKAQARGLGGL